MKKYIYSAATVFLTLMVLASCLTRPGQYAAAADGDTVRGDNVSASADPEHNDNKGGVYMKLKIGSGAPEFSARDSNDINRNLSGLIKEGPVVLVFLRGFS